MLTTRKKATRGAPNIADRENITPKRAGSCPTGEGQLRCARPVLPALALFRRTETKFQGNMPGSTSFIRGLDANQFLMHSSRVAPVATTQRTFRPAR
jgi:hypothetical protein